MIERVDVPPVPGADIQISLILSMLDDGTNEWREELGAVSEEAPLRHLLSQETQQYDFFWPRLTAQPLSWFLVQHDEVRTALAPPPRPHP